MSNIKAYTPPVPVPPPKPVTICPGVTRLSPLTRRGKGPALLVLVGDIACGCMINQGIPTPLMKWAEEGYYVVEITKQAFQSEDLDAIGAALHELNSMAECEPKSIAGLVCYDSDLWKFASSALAIRSEIAGAVAYCDVSTVDAMSDPLTPTLLHIPGTTSTKSPQNALLKFYYYNDQSSARFATPFSEDFNYSAEAVAHTRNLTFLKSSMGSPVFDLEALWDEHTYYEFETREVENTMNTMVQEPYVNHVPTLTGGIGREELTAFYRDHFIFSNPADTQLELISRTVGVDRVVDEFIFKFTHDIVVDWLFPAVPPTNKYVEIAMMAVVNIRGDRLYHEHITWDSASALRQIGYLPDYVPYQGTIRNGDQKDDARPAQLRLPTTGRDTVHKMRNKNSVESNQMFGWGVEHVDI